VWGRLLTSAVFLVTATRCGTRAVVGLPFDGRDLISAPAVLAVGQGHDILLEFDADELAVSGRLELVGAMVLEWCRCRKTSYTGHGTGGQGDGRGLDRVLDDSRGGRDCVVGSGGEQHRCHRDDGGEFDVNHGDGCGCADSRGGRDLPANVDCRLSAVSGAGVCRRASHPSTCVCSTRYTHARLSVVAAAVGTASDERRWVCPRGVGVQAGVGSINEALPVT